MISAPAAHPTEVDASPEARRPIANHHGYARAERILDRGMRAVDGVGAGYSAQRRSGQKQHADVHATGDDQRDDDIPTGDFE